MQAARKQAQRTISAFKEELLRTSAARKLIPEDLAADIMEFRQFSAIAPELAAKRPGIAKELQRIGIVPSIWSPYRVLTKSGDPTLGAIAHETFLANEVMANIRTLGSTRAKDLLKKHKITSDDYGLFIMLEKNPAYKNL